MSGDRVRLPSGLVVVNTPSVSQGLQDAASHIDMGDVNDMELARINERARALNVDPGFSPRVREHLVRVNALMERLIAVCPPDRLRRTMAMIRQNTGNLEPVLESVIERIEGGTFFTDQEPEDAPYVIPSTPGTRKLRRRIQKVAKKREKKAARQARHGA